MHILEDPELSKRVWLLLRHARRMPSMAVLDIRAWAKAERADGNPTGLPAGAVDALVRFEERYGGLWYPNTGYSPHSNGMEYGLGLDGEPLVREGPFGWLIPSACVDGDWTWGVDLLLDGRTVIDLGSGNEPFLVDRDLPQRIEHHAQRALVHNWPHAVFHWETATGTDPALTAGPLIPPRDDAASGPTDHWWTTPDIAIHLHAPDAASRRGRWLVLCHTRHGTDLSALREATLDALPPGVASPATWCPACERATAPYELCDDPHQG